MSCQRNDPQRERWVTVLMSIMAQRSESANCTLTTRYGRHRPCVGLISTREWNISVDRATCLRRRWYGCLPYRLRRNRLRPWGITNVCSRGPWSPWWMKAAPQLNVQSACARCAVMPADIAHGRTAAAAPFTATASSSSRAAPCAERGRSEKQPPPQVLQ